MNMYENQVVVRFSEANDVQKFVNAAEQCDFDIDVKYKNALVDAKSLLGMIAIGLCNNMTVCYSGTNPHFEHVVNKLAIA